MLPRIGQLVAEKYQIEGEIGQGGMAVVLAAHHTLLDKPVAIKILSSELPRTEQLVKRFLAEARAAARVDSVYVARVIDVGTLEDGLPYIVMERLEGRNLEELLESVKQLPVGDAVDHILQALQGLAHAHVLGVIHRDLKPANLFLAQQTDGSTLIKILDFGIAKLVDDARMIARGQTVGSPMYMSPEQVRDAEHVDPRADIWSIGVVLYELLAGRTPFEADGVGNTFKAVLFSTPEPLRTLRPDIPAKLDEAILRCLSQDPAQRFADVAQLATAIAEFGTGACAPLVKTIEQTLRQETRKFSGEAIVARSPSISPLAPVRVAFGNAIDERVTFLYGDSAPSSLQTNFLAFLGDAMDVLAQLLVHDDVVRQCREDVDALPRDAAEETARLEGLVAATKSAMMQAEKKGPDSPTGRVSVAMIEHVQSLVSAEIASLRATRDERLAEIPSKEKKARAGCSKAFETLLLAHDLPGAEVSLDLRRKDDERYVAQLTGVVDYGLRYTLDIEIPANHALSRVVRLEKLAKIEVDAPEMTGWLRKELKLKPQRLDKNYIGELAISPTSMILKLPSKADGEGGGFIASLDLLTSTFQLARLGESNDPPYDLDEKDSAKMRELHEQLLGVAKDLARSRKRLVEATFDDTPIGMEHDPRQVVERIVAILAPIVREIAMHSPSSTELVLKRSTADGKREEVFASKSALLAKLAIVPERAHAVMAPLVLAIQATNIRSSQPSYPGTP
jgi:serine/threonine-protein kinase